MSLTDPFVGTTTFAHGEKDRTHRIWTLFVPPDSDFRISVHRHRDCPPTQWLMSCAAMNISQLTLSEIDIARAKVEALQILSDILESRLKRVNSALALMAPASASTPPPPSSPLLPSD